MFIEINRTSDKNVIARIAYRSPDQNLNEFICDLDIVLNSSSKENKSVFLLGDWNVNLMNHPKHQATSQFLDTLYSKMFFSFDFMSHKDNGSQSGFDRQYFYKRSVKPLNYI